MLREGLRQVEWPVETLLYKICVLVLSLPLSVRGLPTEIPLRQIFQIYTPSHSWQSLKYLWINLCQKNGLQFINILKLSSEQSIAFSLK